MAESRFHVEMTLLPTGVNDNLLKVNSIYNACNRKKSHTESFMYKIARSALIPYSDRQMFDLVNDVNGYQNFLPWCGGSKVLEEVDGQMVASVTIDFKGVKKTFTTRNTLTPDSEIKLEMVDGPFSKLAGYWRFKPLDENASKIILELDFDFSNRLVGGVIGPVFKIIADSMVASFCDEAERRYK